MNTQTRDQGIPDVVLDEQTGETFSVDQHGFRVLNSDPTSTALLDQEGMAETAPILYLTNPELLEEFANPLPQAVQVIRIDNELDALHLTQDADQRRPLLLMQDPDLLLRLSLFLAKFHPLVVMDPPSAAEAELPPSVQVVSRDQLSQLLGFEHAERMAPLPIETDLSEGDVE